MIELDLGGNHRLPVLFQTEAAECGLACLAMVSCYHGHRTDLPTLRRRFAVSLKGLNLLQLMKLAERLDFSCRPIRLELESLGRLRMPAILHWNFNHFVVLKRIKGDRVVIHDPATGLRSLTMNEVSK